MPNIKQKGKFPNILAEPNASVKGEGKKKRGGQDPLAATLGQLGLDDLFESAKVSPGRAFTREDWIKMLPKIKQINSQFGEMLEVLLDLEELSNKDKIKASDLGGLAKKYGFDQVVNKSLEKAKKYVIDKFKDVALKFLSRLGAGKKGKGQSGSKGDYDKNDGSEDVIPPVVPNDSASQGDERGAMSGWAPIVASPNASMFGVPRF